MDADKQVSLHALGFLHAGAQRHKVVAIARQVGTHRVAADAGGVDAGAQQVGNFQYHVFLARAVGADGAWVFAAVAGVQRNDDQAVGAPRWGSRWRRWRRRCGRGSDNGGRWHSRGGCCSCWAGVLGDQRLQWVRRVGYSGGRGRCWCGYRRCGGRGVSCWLGGHSFVLQPFGDQHFQRVNRLRRVQIHHQAMLIGGNWRQGKYLWQCGLLQVDH